MIRTDTVELTSVQAVAFRQKLAEEGDYRLPRIERKLVSAVDGTVKYLYAMKDGECVESVFMRYEHGTSLCVSSEAGCAMGCRFCASTLRGKARNLTASEILGQAAELGVQVVAGKEADGRAASARARATRCI